MTKTTILELLKANRRRFRKQQGTIVERSNAFWVRFYRDGEDGTRVKVTERLCEKSNEFPTADCNAVTVLRDVHMAQINAEHHKELSSPIPLPQAPPLTLGTFWYATYLPWVKANRRWSTHRGYKNIWQQLLKDELETKALSEYRTVDGSQFLTRLAARLNRNSLAHVRSLMSGIFSHATSLGLIDRNPMRDVKVLARVRPPKPRVKYTPEETVAIIDAIQRTDAKLFFALCAVLGMRPSEAAGVKWENISDGVLMVREAAPYGHSEDGLKTERSKRDLTIIEPVLSLITAWHGAMGKPSSGFLFENGDHGPIDHNSFNKYQIKPHAKKVCARYCGPYSGRHGAATALYNLTGDMRAAFQVAGNSFEVLVKNYVEADVEQGKIGLAKYEGALLKAMSKD